jgi:hypothetical protein
MAMGLVLALGLSGAARAGAYADTLSACLVKASTPADRAALMTWLFISMSAHPSVKGLTNITDAQRDEANKRAALLLQRWLTEDCRSQTVDAIKNEGIGALQQAFTGVGQVAMTGLMQDPAVSGQLQGMTKYLDIQKFTALLSDMGQAPPPKK